MKNIRHLVLIFVGIVAGLMFVESTLWALGSVYKTTHRQQTPADDRSLYRIVALGESTTAPAQEPAWPELLEQELNRRMGKRMFRVYNLGVSGTNTEMIVHRLPQDTALFDPDMVITMMGINDTKYFALPPIRHSGWPAQITNLRTYKLVAILIQIIKSSQEKALFKQALSCDGDIFGEDAWVGESLPAYESVIKSTYPANYNGQYNQSQQDKQAEFILTSFLKTYPFSYSAYEVIVRHYAARSDWQNALRWADNMEKVFPYMRLCVATDSARLRLLGDVSNEIKTIRTIAQESIKHASLMVPYYEQIQAILGTQGAPNIDTKKNYQTLARMLAAQDIHYVAMQYPLLPVSDIATFLEEIPTVTHISNDDNFRNALNYHSYNDLFTDNFAGIFGHTTPFGSLLIASRAADVILKIVQ